MQHLPQAGLMLRCCRDKWRSIGELRAAIAYGKDRARSQIELAAWTRLTAWEHGDFKPLSVLVPELPEDASESARVARDGYQRLIGLRWADGPHVPVPFSVRFVVAWCGLSTRYRAETALTELRDGVIWAADEVPRSGRHEPMPLYLPGRGER